MQCSHCEKTIDNNSWLHLTNISSVNDDGDEIYEEKHICGYSCYKLLSESGVLPKKLWPHVVNKSDYEGLLRPVSRFQKRRFEYLSYDEIQRLDDVGKEKYLKEKQEQLYLNPDLSKFHEEMIEEDERTAYLEEMDSDSDILDDY